MTTVVVGIVAAFFLGIAAGLLMAALWLVRRA